jgi:hypothetical protein
MKTPFNKQFQFLVFHEFLNVEFRIGLQSNPNLTLIVEGTVITTVVQVNSCYDSFPLLALRALLHPNHRIELTRLAALSALDALIGINLVRHFA